MGTLTRVPILVPCRRVLLVVTVWAEGGGFLFTSFDKTVLLKGGEATADSMVRKSLWYSLAAQLCATVYSWLMAASGGPSCTSAHPETMLHSRSCAMGCERRGSTGRPSRYGEY